MKKERNPNVIFVVQFSQEPMVNLWSIIGKIWLKYVVFKIVYNITFYQLFFSVKIFDVILCRIKCLEKQAQRFQNENNQNIANVIVVGNNNNLERTNENSNNLVNDSHIVISTDTSTLNLEDSDIPIDNENFNYDTANTSVDAPGLNDSLGVEVIFFHLN